MSLRNLAFNIDVNGNAGPIEKMNTATDKLKKSAQSAGDKMAAMGKTMQTTGKNLMKGVTLPLVGVGVAALKTVSNFDDGMANIQKLSGATGKDFDNLREKAKELGSTTAYSASEAADGMGVLASSRMATNDILASSGDMFNLMSAGSVSAETAADILTGTMAQFNRTVEDSGYIADTFSATSAKSKISVDQLSHGMKLSGATMAGMNMGIAQSTAAFGHLANSGMNVEQLGTTINAMGREVSANAKDFKKLGINVYDSAGEAKGLNVVMAELEKTMVGKTDAEKDAAMASVFSGQAMQGAKNWLNEGSAAYDELTDSIIMETNAAETMAAIQEDTVGGAFRAVKSATEGMMIEIGDVIKKPVQDVAKVVSKAAGAFGKLSDPMKKIIVVGAAIAAAIGPLIWIGGKLMVGIPALGGKLAFIVSPVGLVIAAVVGLVGVLIYLWKTNEEFKNRVLGIWGSITTSLGQALDYMKGFWEEHGGYITETVIHTCRLISELIGKVIGFIVNIVSVGLAIISEFWSKHGKSIMQIASLAWVLIGSIIEGAMLFIQGAINLILGVIQGNWERAWNGVRTIFEGVMIAIGAAWNLVKALLGKVIKGTVSAITDKFHTAMDSVKEKWESIKTFLRNPIKGTVSMVQKGADKVKGWFGGSHKTGLNKVPYDNYPAMLHDNEMVLTSAASDQFRAMGGTKDGLSATNDYSVSTTTTKSVNSGNKGATQLNFNPNYNIEIKGNATEKDSRELVSKIDMQTRKTVEKMFEEFQIQMG